FQDRSGAKMAGLNFVFQGLGDNICIHGSKLCGFYRKVKPQPRLRPETGVAKETRGAYRMFAPLFDFSLIPTRHAGGFLSECGVGTI
ncbi:hypothetical protein, partial [Thalassospira sp.]|uniref:hypothetical protein n=1 Tax=Thalassospira sp. TaxID=1912094 RepID=UPI00311DC7CB